MYHNPFTTHKLLQNHRATMTFTRSPVVPRGPPVGSAAPPPVVRWGSAAPQPPPGGSPAAAPAARGGRAASGHGFHGSFKGI